MVFFSILKIENLGKNLNVKTPKNVVVLPNILNINITNEEEIHHWAAQLAKRLQNI